MLAEKNHLQLVTVMTENETALVELNPTDVEEVSGAIVWAAIPIGWKIAGAIAGGTATGIGIGWLVNR